MTAPEMFGNTGEEAAAGRAAAAAEPAGAGRVAAADEPAGAGEPAGAAELEAIAFAGSALAPFFLNDPRTGEAADAFAALAELDVEAAAAEWPFVDADNAADALGSMVQGLAAGADNEALVWEYRRLFVGPGHLPAAPWGSVYTDRDAVVFGASTLALRAWMAANGIRRTADERTPDDHIGLMLAQLAFLAVERPDLLDDFLCNHFLTWAPHYLEALEAATTHPFYEGLARLMRLTLAGMEKARGLSVVTPRFYR